MEKLIRLHLGCGPKKWPGYLNIDSEMDLRELPFEDEAVDEIQAIHLFEHLPRAEVGDYLSEWSRILKPGGQLILEMPDLEKICAMILAGERRQHLTLLGIFGDARYGDPLMLHRWAWAQWELEKVVGVFGFDVTFEDPVFHFLQRDLRMVAFRR